jgi:hypothetical protein
MSEPSLTVRDENISSLYTSSADITISNDYIRTSKDIIAEPAQESLASRLFNMKKENNNA